MGAEPGAITRQSSEAFRRISFPRAVRTWEFRPQDRAQRHTVIAHAVPGLPTLDVSCASYGGTAGGRAPVLRRASSCGCRTGYRSAHPDANPGLEVPTILHFLKRKVDIPFPGGGGRLADLEGFRPEQSSTAPPFSEQIVDIPVPGGCLQGFRPGQSSAASSSSSHSPAGVHEDANEPGVCFFFRTFSRPKESAKVTQHSSARVPRQVNSSTLSAHQMAPGWS